MKGKLRYFNVLLLLMALACSPAGRSGKKSLEIRSEASSTAKTDGTISEILRNHPHLFDSLVRNSDKWKISIIYTRIDRNSNNLPSFRNFYFNTGHTYHYPASTVKLPVAMLALQRLNELNIPGLNRNTTMITEAQSPALAAVYNDPDAADGRPTIANYIKKIFLVSDNDAFNRLYEFLGPDYINSRLHQMGYDSVQIIHRLDLPLTEAQNRLTNKVSFYDDRAQLVYTKPSEYSRMKFQPRNDMAGKGYMSNDRLVDRPFNFSSKNRLPLSDAHAILQSVIFPGSFPENKQFNLSPDDYEFLYRVLSMKPGESVHPDYGNEYEDAYIKFLMFGGSGAIRDSSIRIFNKSGDAYGFLTDVAYITDIKNGVEFFLSATIYANSDGIINDDHYDYETTGFPFMKNLGEVFYQYELKRSRDNKPDLSRFKLDYTNQKSLHLSE